MSMALNNVQNLHLIDETIVAIRAEMGWRLHTFKCRPCEVAQHLARAGLAYLPHRIIAHHRVTKGSFGNCMSRLARSAGWQQWDTEVWFPMDEPMPEPAGEPKPGTFALKLRGIFYGLVIFIMEIDGRRFRFSLDQVEDSLVLFTQFVQLLGAGLYPRGALFDGGSTDVITYPGPQSGLCRIWTNPWRDGKRETIDIIVDKARLIEQFVALAAEIAAHPCFGHEFVLFSVSTDEDYEYLSEIAEATFAEALAQRRVVVPDVTDDMAVEDAEADFIVRHLVAKRPLTTDQSRCVEPWQTMLRTLTIPDDWTLAPEDRGFD